MAYAAGGAYRELGRALTDFGFTAGDLRRQRAEDEMLAGERQTAQQMADANFDLRLAGMGGGRGSRPSVSREVPIPEPMGEFEAPEFGPSPSYGVQAPSDFMPAPEFEDVPTLDPSMRETYETPDPRFMPIGGEDFAYIKRPEVMEKEAGDKARSDAARTRHGIGRAITRVQGGGTAGVDGFLVDYKRYLHGLG